MFALLRFTRADYNHCTPNGGLRTEDTGPDAALFELLELLHVSQDSTTIAEDNQYLFGVWRGFHWDRSKVARSQQRDPGIQARFRV